MPHACHRFWKCYKTLTFCSLLTRCTIPGTYHAKAPLNVQKCSVPHSFLRFWLRNVLRATTACTFSTSQLPKVLWTPSVFYTFDFEMCFAPQRRALFRHLNFQKCSEPPQFYTILTSKCALRHNGVHFFDISISKSGPDLVWFVHFAFELRNVFRAATACNFSSLICPRDPHPPLQRAYFSTLRSHKSEKHSVSRLSYLFAHLHLLSSDSFSSTLLSSSLLFTDSSHLCFSSVHIVGSLTSKLPSIKCGVESVKYRVWSAKCRRESAKCRVWSVKCRV